MTDSRFFAAPLLILALVLSGCTATAAEPAANAPQAATTAPAAPKASEAPVAAPKAAEPAKEPAAPAAAAAGTALEQLAAISIKGRAPKTGYSRDMFGSAWPDLDGDGCDERNEILARDLTNISFKDGHCVVASGTFADPYTGRTIDFTRGTKTSSAIQIDHVVALSDAWQKGAQGISAAQRVALANDPLNLMAADGPANGSKSDSDAATWLPANKGFRCGYVARQTSVKAKYGLWMTQAEHDAIAGILAGCPQEPAPAEAAANTPAPPVAPEPRPAAPVEPAAPAAEEPAPAGGPVSAGDVAYPNCAAVRAAGAAPIRTGDPGYAPRLDRDGDGVGCE